MQYKTEIQNDEQEKMTPLHVEGKGFKFDFSDQVVNLLSVFERIEQDFYPTWQEAAKAVISLDIKTKEAYENNYKKDPRLHSSPRLIYKNFPGWNIFIGKRAKPYATCKEASIASVVLGITGHIDYSKKYKEDMKLPSMPERFYKNFPGWQKFLRTERNFYPTWQEASVAAISLGIKTHAEYKLNYQKDRRLCSVPENKYKDFPDWKTFLRTHNKFYATWQEASIAAIALDIKSAREYAGLNGGYTKDDKLPSSPSIVYDDFPGWIKFLGLEKKTFYETWQEASVAAISLGITGARNYFENYKKDSLLNSSPDRHYKDFPGWEKFLGKE